MVTNNATYFSKLHGLVDRYYGSKEFRTLCFDLSVDFDSLGGEGKSSKVRELILALARIDRLQELVNLTEWQRPNVDWPPVPENFQMPSSLASSPASGGTQNINRGEVIQGNKIGGDKVGGDQITIGNISGSGFAIGRSASATATSSDTTQNYTNFLGDNLTIKSRLQAAYQTIGTPRHS
jgi:hypothetical protein